MNQRDRSIRGKALVLLAINLVLVVVVVIQISVSGDKSGPPAMAGQQRSTDSTELMPANTEYLAPAITYYEDIVSRPLFSKTRLPPRQEVLPDRTHGKKNVAPPTFTLIGVVLTQQVSKALLLTKKGRETVHAKPGDKIEGWQLDAVRPDRVEISQGEYSTELILERIPASTAGRKGAKIPPSMVPGPS